MRVVQIKFVLQHTIGIFISCISNIDRDIHEWLDKIVYVIEGTGYFDLVIEKVVRVIFAGLI
jgi:hypothetical protein